MTRHEKDLVMGLLRVIELLNDCTAEQLAELAIRVSLWSCEEPKFVEWAEKWLSGDRSMTTAGEVAKEVKSEMAREVAEMAWAVGAQMRGAVERTAMEITIAAIRETLWGREEAK